MITVQQDNNNLILSFKYYEEYIYKSKKIGAKFDRYNKAWMLPICNFKKMKDEFAGELYFKTPEWEITKQPPPDYSQIYKFDTVINIEELEFKIQPFNYQKFGIKFIIDRLLNNGMAFLCDDVGLGKTIQAIGAIKYIMSNNLSSNVVIVCKKSIKEQWKEEIEKFVNIDANIYVIPGTKSKRNKIYKQIEEDKNPKITIVNYHILLNDKKHYKPDFVIYDEAHVAKKVNGEINKSCRHITKKSNYCLFMTGTPIMNKPDDLYGIVSIKDKKYFGSSYKEFESMYITKSNNKTVGYKNLDELRLKCQRLILRRTANEVVIDLPEIFEINKYIEMDNLQKETSKFVEKMIEKTEEKLLELNSSNINTPDIAEKIKKIDGSMKGFIAIEQVLANNPRLFAYSKSKSVVHNYKPYTPDENYISNKYSKLLDIMEDIKESGNKAIIFTKYETVAKHVAAFLNKNKIQSVVYFGSLNGDQRENVIKSFKYNDEISAIIGTDSLAEGVNLQCANTVIHIDLPYNIAIYQQRNGRARRAGSEHKTVIVYNLITKGSIDESIYKKIRETKQNFDVFISSNTEQSKLLKKLSN